MASNNIKNLRATSFSQGDYTKSVAENKRQFFKDIVDDRFTYETDYETDFEEQSQVGSTLYKLVGVRITRAISSGLSENFANEVKKVIFQDHDHEQYLGKQYIYKGKTWLTTNINETTGASSHSIIRMCNNKLKWINPSNSEEVYEWDCVFTKQFTGTSFKEGSEGVPQVNGDFMVLIQQNDLTKTIPFNQRFIFNQHAFQVSQINNHISDTYMVLKVFETQIQPNDDLINGIANANGLPPKDTKVEILPQINTINEGQSQSYSVYNYIDGVPNSDTFTIIGTQAPQEYYTLTVVDGNNFQVTNLMQSVVNLIVVCTDVENPSAQATTIEIVLGGSW